MTGFDQTQHPRNAAGTSKGGQFAAKHNSAPETELSASEPNMSRPLSEHDREIARRTWEECKQAFRNTVTSEAFDWDGGDEDTPNPYEPVREASACRVSESGVEYWSKAGSPGVLHRVDGPAIVAPGRLPHYRRENLPTDSAGRPLVWGPDVFGPETWRQLQDDQDLYDAYTIGARAVSEGSDEVTGEYLFDLKGDGKRAEEIWATYQMGAEVQRDMMLNQWRSSH